MVCALTLYKLREGKKNFLCLAHRANCPLRHQCNRRQEFRFLKLMNKANSFGSDFISIFKSSSLSVFAWNSILFYFSYGKVSFSFSSSRYSPLFAAIELARSVSQFKFDWRFFKHFFFAFRVCKWKTFKYSNAWTGFDRNLISDKLPLVSINIILRCFLFGKNS